MLWALKTSISDSTHSDVLGYNPIHNFQQVILMKVNGIYFGVHMRRMALLVRSVLATRHVTYTYCESNLFLLFCGFTLLYRIRQIPMHFNMRSFAAAVSITTKYVLLPTLVKANSLLLICLPFFYASSLQGIKRELKLCRYNEHLR